MVSVRRALKGFLLFLIAPLIFTVAWLAGRGLVKDDVPQWVRRLISWLLEEPDNAIRRWSETWM